MKSEEEAAEIRRTVLYLMEEFSPDQMAECGIGLIAVAAFRAKRQEGRQAGIDILESVSSFTSTLHIEARQEK